jgi:serine/threonine protein phosphatase PrpC
MNKAHTEPNNPGNPSLKTTELENQEIKEIGFHQGSFMDVKNLTILESTLSGAQQPYEEKPTRLTGEENKETFLKRCEMWTSCKKGTKQIPNQDNFLIILDQSDLLFSVFDGHGIFGHKVSDYLQKDLPKLLLGNVNWQEDPCKAFRECFVQSHSNLIRVSASNSADFDINMSGSTCSMVLKRSQKLYLGHVGDSRAVIGKRTDEEIIPVQLTQDHRPESSKERSRVETAGGQIRSLPGGPSRVYFKGKEYPGISITRAIGDLVSQNIGIVSVPDTMVYDLTENDEFIILATDGIWEFISNQEAVRIVSSSNDAKEATSRLSALAWSKWLSAEDDLVDDITVIVAYFKKMHPETVQSN